MRAINWKRETTIAAGLFFFGAFILPVAIFVVGRRLIGEYSEDAGALALAEHIWTDLLALRPSAWLLVLSPYLVVQLGRLVRRVWRRSEL
jgi:hypothetical protein